MFRAIGLGEKSFVTGVLSLVALVVFSLVGVNAGGARAGHLERQ